MSKATSGALRKTVDRAGFFRWGADGVKRMGKEFISSIIEQMGESYDVFEWVRLTDEKAVGARPRLFFARGNPLFVVNNAEKGWAAFSAICPEEGGMMEWRENQGSFCCPFCQARYNREGKADGTPDIAMVRHKIQVVDGQVLIGAEHSGK